MEVTKGLAQRDAMIASLRKQIEETMLKDDALDRNQQLVDNLEKKLRSKEAYLMERERKIEKLTGAVSKQRVKRDQLSRRINLLENDLQRKEQEKASHEMRETS